MGIECFSLSYIYIRERGRTGGWRDGWTDGLRVGRTDGRTEAGNQRGREAERQGGREAGRQGDREAGRGTGLEADREAGRETGRETGRQTSVVRMPMYRKCGVYDHVKNTNTPTTAINTSRKSYLFGSHMHRSTFAKLFPDNLVRATLNCIPLRSTFAHQSRARLSFLCCIL